MRGVAEALRALIEAVPALHVLLPVHPNPQVRDVILQALGGLDRVHIVDPLPYDSFVFMLASVDAVLTDSGGLQEESIALGKRLFIMRQTSERPEALQSGRATLVGTNPAVILQHVGAWAVSLASSVNNWKPPMMAAQSIDGLGSSGEDIFPVSSFLSGNAAYVARPASRLVFGDGLASARISRTSLSFVERYRFALLPNEPDLEVQTKLRQFMSCDHATYTAESLSGSPRLSDHYFHDFVN
jgi:hypothetical protein